VAGAFSKAQHEGRTLVWVDESAFYLVPGVVRTYAPRGQTPLLRAPLSRDHVAALGALTSTGRVLLRRQRASVRGPDVVAFLRQVLRQVAGPLLLVWDGAPIHWSQPVRAFLGQPSARRLHIEPLPAYAPDLNPVEDLWQHLKHVELRNLVNPSLWDVEEELRLAVRRVRRKAAVLRGCLAHAGCL
jgi:transposase